MLHHDVEDVVVSEVGLVAHDVMVAADFEELSLGLGLLLGRDSRVSQGFLLVLGG